MKKKISPSFALDLVRGAIEAATLQEKLYRLGYVKKRFGIDTLCNRASRKHMTVREYLLSKAKT